MAKANIHFEQNTTKSQFEKPIDHKT